MTAPPMASQAMSGSAPGASSRPAIAAVARACRVSGVAGSTGGATLAASAPSRRLD